MAQKPPVRRKLRPAWMRAAAVNAGIHGYNMYLNGSQFWAGDGIVSKGVENTIRNVGRLGRDGMRETDREILKIMTEE